MKKQLILSLCALLALPVWAKPVKTEDKAIDLVQASIKKHKLLSIDISCVFFMANEDEQTYFVDVRENHNARCGGDPNVAPRLLSYEVNKKTGKLCTDSWTYAERIGVEPSAMQCNLIK